MPDISKSTGNTRSSLTVLKDGLCFRQTIARQRLTGSEEDTEVFPIIRSVRNCALYEPGLRNCSGIEVDVIHSKPCRAGPLCCISDTSLRDQASENLEKKSHRIPILQSSLPRRILFLEGEGVTGVY
jgi:hypothetical protein